MSHILNETSQFKHQLRRVRKSPRWRPIFEGHVPFDSDERSPWDYVTDCLLTGSEIPDYFYVHPLHFPKSLEKQIKRRLPTSEHVTIQVLELHFDGHNGNHLLVFYDSTDVTTLLAIGTHSDLFS
ncbi:replication associated protein [Levilactobacillus parabrevis]|nr:replication associated protein [Levilactobacillus parabrevis]MCT4489845.1 replication associated protein [Levilactobacillus parabrevis]